MPATLTTKRPVGLLLLLGLKLIAATTYQVRVAEVRDPEWFGIDNSWRPFYVSGAEGKISFLVSATKKVGLKEGDSLLSINGRPMTGKAVFGEELMKARPGEAMTVTVLRHEAGQPALQKTFAVPLGHVPSFPWKARIPSTLLLLVLPYLAILLGFWVTFARPRDPLAWLVLAIMTSYFGFGESSAEQWGPYVRDLAVIFRTTALSTFPIWLLLFGIYFPEPFPAASRWAHWRWLKWAFIVPLALFALFDVIRDVGWLENYASVAFLQHMPKAFYVADAVLSYMALGWPVGLILVKYQSAISADAKRRLRLLAASAAVGLGPFPIASHLGDDERDSGRVFSRLALA